jgi:hypothetical protein
MIDGADSFHSSQINQLRQLCISHLASIFMLNRVVIMIGLVSGLVVFYGFSNDLFSENSTGTINCSTTISTASCNGYAIEACSNDVDTWYQADGNYICSYTSGSSLCVTQVVNYCNTSDSKNTLTTTNANNHHPLFHSWSGVINHQFQG